MSIAAASRDGQDRIAIDERQGGVLVGSSESARLADDAIKEPGRAINSTAFAAMLAAADLGPLSDAEQAALHAMIDRVHAQIVTLRTVETTDIEPDIAFVADRPAI